MKSKWFGYKSRAVKLREAGLSLRGIEKQLGVPRSTLSNWLGQIKLTTAQQKILAERKNEGLVSARKKAVLWHNKQKQERVLFAEASAGETLSKIQNSNEQIELALALLYLGEGIKKSPTTRMGNSDPLIVKFFLVILKKIYKVQTKNISVYLHLRADQHPDKLKKYWSKELDIPLGRFKKVSIDKRTVGTKTFPHYKGVCVIDCGSVAIQRKLVYIARKFCEKTIVSMRG